MPTRKPGFGSGNRLVSRLNRIDDEDNNVAYRIGANNLNKKRFPAGAPAVPAGNIALEAFVFEFAQSFGTDLGNYGISLTAGGLYRFSAEANTGVPFWQEINFGTNWVDDAGASNAQFEAQLVLLNGGSVNNPVFTGWSGYDEWLPLTQNLEWLDINDQPASSSNAVIIQVEVREIAVPGNIVTSNYQGGMDNEP